MTAYARVEFGARTGADGGIEAVEPLGGNDGASPARSPGLEFAITLRSVNSRFLDLSINLPKDLREFEEQIAQLARGRIRRGKLDISLDWLGEAQPVSGEASEADLGRYLDRLRTVYELRARAPIGPVDPVALLQMADNASRRSAPVVKSGWSWPKLLPCFEQTLDDFEEGRCREGEAIRQHLSQNHANCLALLEQIAKQRSASTRQMRERLEEQVAALVGEHSPDKLEEELLYLLKRHDVEEEFNRLSAHLIALGQMLARADGKDEEQPAGDSHSLGKRINFLVQEMGREANTIGSKAANHETSMIAIEIKLELERMREQVANLE